MLVSCSHAHFDAKAGHDIDDSFPRKKMGAAAIYGQSGAPMRVEGGMTAMLDLYESAFEMMMRGAKKSWPHSGRCLSLVYTLHRHSLMSLRYISPHIRAIVDAIFSPQKAAP